MAQYKQIESACHNWAHSFLSLENFDEHGYFAESLYQSSKAQNQSKVVINLLTGEVSPGHIKNSRLAAFTKHIPWQFGKQLRSQNVELAMVRSARLEIRYDLQAGSVDYQGYVFRDPGSAPVAVPYCAEVYLIDDRGKQHAAKVKEWWRS
ncbi:hypothetical protein ACQUWM_10390 [Marinobacter sp. DUT-3]|uniref:hypothetical protein n=1 Tax=Marinobacter sp. DUT-3 TaxID=3412036 RepID=UPI003D17A773